MPAESKGAGIWAISKQSQGDILVLVDCINKSIKSLNIATGTLSVLFQESKQEWYVTAGLLVGDLGCERLIMAESRGYWSKSKRLVVAEKATSKSLFTHKYELPFEDDESVSTSSVANFASISS